MFLRLRPQSTSPNLSEEWMFTTVVPPSCCETLITPFSPHDIAETLELIVMTPVPGSALLTDMPSATVAAHTASKTAR